MKKIYAYVLALSTCFFFFAQKSFAQQSSFSFSTPQFLTRTLDGENIISAVEVGSTSKAYSDGKRVSESIRASTVAVTGNRVYVYNNNFFNEDFSTIFIPPTGETITQAGYKQYTDTTDTVISTHNVRYITVHRDLMILTNKGGVYKINATAKGKNNPFVPYTKVAEIGTVSWQEILADGGGAHVVTSNHMWINTDSSAAWQVDSAGLKGAHVYQVGFDSLENYYAATNRGIYKRKRYTKPFIWDSTYTGPQDVGSIFIDREQRAYAGPKQGGAYVSTDSTAGWYDYSAGLGTAQPQKFEDDAFSNVYCIAAINGQEQHIYKSAKGTSPWEIIDSSIYNKTVAIPAINTIAGDSALIAGTSFGAFFSVDTGNTWVQDNTGIMAEFISGIAKPIGGGLIVSDNLGVYKQQLTTGWNKVYPFAGFTPKLAMYDDGIGDVYAINNAVPGAPAAGIIYKSTDGGVTWVLDTAGLSAIGGSVFFVDEKGTQHIGNSYYAGTKPSQLWQKPKGGTWAIDTVGFPVLAYSFVFNIASDGKGYVYAGGSFGGKKLMRRSITGTAWQVDTAGIPSSISYFDQLTGGKGDVLGITGTSVYHRGSGTWQRVPLPATVAFPIVTAACIDTSGFITVALNASTGSGVYITGDAGQNWEFVGLDSANITKLVAYGDTVYVLTSNMGLYAFNHESTLPVTLSSIRASQLGKGIRVQWSGYNEVNMKGYGVERSADGTAFTELGTVAAKNNLTVNDYSFFDASPINGDNFYRIKAVGKDGNSQYSGVAKVSIADAKTGLVVYPNPVTNKTINVQLNSIAIGNYSLEVYNAAGQKVYGETLNHPGGNAAIAINLHGAAKGVYWVILKGTKHSYTKNILLQ